MRAQEMGKAVIVKDFTNGEKTNCMSKKHVQM